MIRRPLTSVALKQKEFDVLESFLYPISSRAYPKLKDLDEVLGGSTAWENAQVTDEICPKCSNSKAYFMQLQTRSADELMTIFYRCTDMDCAHQWKE